MKRVSLATIWLQCRLFVRKYPLATIAALIWVAPVVAWLTLVPHLRAVRAIQVQDIAALRDRLARNSAIAPVAPRPIGQQRLDAFYAALADEDEVGQQLRRMLALAAQNSLQSSAADYRFSENPTGKFQTYQIGVPVQGTYPAIRKFCEQVLVTLPFASLDEVSFRRTAIGNNKLEVRLRFTFFLKAAMPLKGRS